MTVEKMPDTNLPEEINIDVKDLEPKVNAEGKKYVYEKDGVYYGADYLDESPQEIDLEFPSAPPHKDSLAI